MALALKHRLKGCWRHRAVVAWTVEMAASSLKEPGLNSVVLPYVEPAQGSEAGTWVTAQDTGSRDPVLR